MALKTFFLGMSLNPDIQKKAQAELDEVVGPDRLPTHEDRDRLVYVNAILKEMLRWMTPIPLGLEHCMIEDDELHGYFIPKGTIVIPNIFAMNHDPEIFPDPDVFRPER